MSGANGEAAADAADLDAVLDALFRGPRESFVTERNAAALRLTASGRGEDAALVKALTKPNLSTWAVNRLWWSHRAQMDALFEAARRQALALQSGGGPAEQASASQARRRALDGLLRSATEVLREAGHATGAGTMRKISTSLDALAAYATRGDGPTPGRLTADLAPPGFDLLAGLQVSAPPPSAPATDEPSTDEPAVHEAQQALHDVRQRREAARDRAREAAQGLDHATRHADEATLAAQRAAAAHEDAEAKAVAARQVAQEAERVLLKAQAHARREHQRATDARRALEGLTAELSGHDDALQRAQERLEALRRG